MKQLTLMLNSEKGPTLWRYFLSFWLIKKEQPLQSNKLPQSQILVRIIKNQGTCLPSVTFSKEQFDRYIKDKMKETKDWVNQFN